MAAAPLHGAVVQPRTLDTDAEFDHLKLLHCGSLKEPRHEHHHCPRPKPPDAGPTALGSRRTWGDWLFALLVVVGAAIAFQRYQASMDGYEKAILVGTVPAMICAGLVLAPAAHADAGGGGGCRCWPSATTAPTASAPTWRADSVFLLKYLLSSQSGHPVDEHAVLHEHGVLLDRHVHPRPAGPRWKVWAGQAPGLGRGGMALMGTMVRWYESHQIAPDIGHIPVSNLYEVFVLFCWLTALFYLYYEAQLQAPARWAPSSCWWSARRSASCSGTRWCARRTRSSRWCRPAELVDEAARAGQLHRLRHLRAGGHGGLCLPDQAAGAETRWYKLAPIWIRHRAGALCFWPFASATRPKRAAATGRLLR
jgi:hypothetical protein